MSDFEYDYLGARLIKQVSIEEVEAENMYGYDVPFDPGNEEWEAFKSNIKEGDELWEWSTSQSSWDMLRGSSGYAILRNGEVISSMTTHIN